MVWCAEKNPPPTPTVGGGWRSPTRRVNRTTNPCRLPIFSPYPPCSAAKPPYPVLEPRASFTAHHTRTLPPAFLFLPRR